MVIPQILPNNEIEVYRSVLNNTILLEMACNLTSLIAEYWILWIARGSRSYGSFDRKRIIIVPLVFDV